MTTVRIPDVDIGITSFRKAPKRVRPSTIAASSSSLGIDLKNPISNQIENGIVKLGYTTTSDQMLSCSPRIATMRDSGMNSRVGGTRYVRKMMMPSRPPQRPVRRASEYAAGSASSSVIMTTRMPTSAVLPSQRRYLVSKNRIFKCSHVGEALKMNGLLSVV